jgi:hypothetical protein
MENNFTGKSVCSLSYPGDDLYRILGILDGAFLRNGCNQQKIAARQFGELFL